jgi:hypothetical protein
MRFATWPGAQADESAIDPVVLQPTMVSEPGHQEARGRATTPGSKPPPWPWTYLPVSGTSRPANADP